MAKGFYDQAIDAAKDTVPLRFSHGALCREYVSGFPFSGDLAARAYEKRGDLNEAIEEYERLTAPEPGERGRWLIHPLYHFRLAKLYERKGWKGKALERYDRFLELWKDADPLFSEIGEAKKRAAALSQYP